MLEEWRGFVHGCDLSRLSLLVHTVSLQARRLRDPRAACHELKDFALGVLDLPVLIRHGGRSS